MPNFKHYNYNQSAMVIVNFEDQIQPGTVEHTVHYLIDNSLDLSIFDDIYKNDHGGRAAYDSAILLKIILFAYSKALPPVVRFNGTVKTILFIKPSLATPYPTLRPLPLSSVATVTPWKLCLNKSYWCATNKIYWAMSSLPLMVAKCHRTPPRNGQALIKN